MTSSFSYSGVVSPQPPTLGSLLFEGPPGPLPTTDAISLSASAPMSASRSESSSADLFDNQLRVPQRSVSSAGHGKRPSKAHSSQRYGTNMRSPGAKHSSPLASSSASQTQQRTSPRREAAMIQPSKGYSASTATGVSPAGIRSLPRRPLPAPPEGARAGCLASSSSSSHSTSRSHAMSPTPSSSSNSSTRPIPSVSPIPIPSKDDPGLSYSSGESSSSSMHSEFSSSSQEGGSSEERLPLVGSHSPYTPSRSSSAVVRSITRTNSASKPSLLSRSSYTRRTQANTTAHRKKTTSPRNGKLVPEGQRRKTPVPMNFTGGFDDEGNALFADEFEQTLVRVIPNRMSVSSPSFTSKHPVPPSGPRSPSSSISSSLPSPPSSAAVSGALQITLSPTTVTRAPAKSVTFDLEESSTENEATPVSRGLTRTPSSSRAQKRAGLLPTARPPDAKSNASASSSYAPFSGSSTSLLHHAASTGHLEDFLHPSRHLRSHSEPFPAPSPDLIPSMKEKEKSRAKGKYGALVGARMAGIKVPVLTRSVTTTASFLTLG